MNFFFRPLPLLLMLLLPPLALAESSVERIYHKQCATCHGDNGDGQGRAGVALFPPATNFRSPAVHGRSDAELARAIREGRPGTTMSAYGSRLSAAQIQALVDYIRKSFMQQAAPPAAPVAQLPTAPQHSESARKQLGRKIYEENCSACHGDRGNTAIWARNGLVPAPRDFTTELSRKLLGRERMVKSVTNGRPGTGMMSFANRLQPHEIEAVVDFIRSEFMKVGDLSLFELSKQHSREDKPMPQGLQGDAAWGRAFFMANCADCHGTHGDGKGPRAYFNRPAPRDFTTAQSHAELDRPRLFDAIKHGRRGSVMPAWGQVLSDQEVANVAEFVYQHFIQQQPVAEKKKP